MANVCHQPLLSLTNLRQSHLINLSNHLHSPNLEDISPEVGIPIEIPTMFKGHGCRHAINHLHNHGQECFVETKYDGQRMQIHINLSLSFEKQVQIYSKSRVVSTKKRKEIIPYYLLKRKV